MRRSFLFLLVLIALSTNLFAQPNISGGPTNAIVPPGQNVTFGVTVAGTCSLSYQWQFNGTNLPNGIITTVAGAGNQYIFGDGGPPLVASLNAPEGVFADTMGNLYIADSGNDTIREVTSNGIISRRAGVGYQNGFFLANAPALAVSLNNPADVAVDASGNVFFTDQLYYRVCEVYTNGQLATIAGDYFDDHPTPTFSGDGGPAAGAGLNRPTGLAFDSFGNLFIADTSNNRIRRIDTNGIITTVAGSGPFGYSGDGGFATNAVLNAPSGVAVDASGNLYIADYGNNVIRKVDTNGIISGFAGNGTNGFGGDGGPATNAYLNFPQRVLIDPSGNLWISDGNFRLRKVDTNGIINSVGLGSVGKMAGLSMDPVGNLYIADTSNNRILKMDTNGIFTTVVGTGSTTYTGDGGPATTSRLELPQGVAVDLAGNVFIADQSFNRIRRIDANGIMSTFAGTGTAGFLGDGGPANLSRLNAPYDVFVDPAGNVLVSDQNNNRIREISPNGIISTIAGNGTTNFSGDGGMATNAALNQPAGITMDASGDLFIADKSDNRVREVSPNGIIATIAGNGVNGYTGDNVPATNAALSFPHGVAVDSIGNIFIADYGNSRVREVGTNGMIRTIAGTNIFGFSGDGGLALTNRVSGPSGILIDTSGNILFSDQGNSRIRKIDTNGILTTIAGSNIAGGLGGDGGPATNALLYDPAGIRFDAAGNLLIADQLNYRVRKITYADQPLLTLLNVNSNNIGNYQVVVTDSCSGSVTSSVATLFLTPQIQTASIGFAVEPESFGFAVSGSSNQVIIIEASTDLVSGSWVPLQTNMLGTGPFYFTDPNWTNYANRFYRVGSP